MKRHWLIFTLATVLWTLAVAGCGYNENKGTSRANIQPKVFITNFPQASDSRITAIDTTWRTDSTIVSIDTTYDYGTVVDTIIYLANPRIYWFGTDEDGRVDAFEYAVVPTDSLRGEDSLTTDHPVGLATVRDSLLVVNPLRFVNDVGLADRSFDWVQLLPGDVPEVHSSTVLLFADIDTTKSVDQFLFVRAIDNEGLRSNIEFARYARQNHPPDTYVELDTIEVITPNIVSDTYVRNRKYYSLPQSTSTYPGITIGWSGSDSTDFPDEQPPFRYNWSLFGPYQTYAAAATPDPGKMVRTSGDPSDLQKGWTDVDRHTFFNLRSGWYLFGVSSLDDAFVADPTPAYVRFQVVEPSFVKPFILLDATNWFHQAQSNMGAVLFGPVPREDGLTVDTILGEIFALFEGQGHSFDRNLDVWHRMTFRSRTEDAQPLPDRDVLGEYRAVIVFDEDVREPLDTDQSPNGHEFEGALSDYMDVGGRVILIGRNLFASSVTGWSTRDLPQEAELTAADWGFQYFGVTRMFFAGATGPAIDDGIDISDFMSTIPLDPAYPAVTVDTIRTLFLSQIPKEPFYPWQDRDGDGALDWLWIPDVNWIGIDRNRNADGIYQFNSFLPNTSPSQGRICGARYEFIDPVLGLPTYRTAIVTFPIWTMKSDANLRALIGELLDYILE